MQTIVDNASTAARMFDLFKKGDIQTLISMMHPNVVWTCGGTAPIPYAGTYKGQKETASFFSRLADAVEFTEFVPEKILNADEHLVASIGHFKGFVKKTKKEFKSDWVMIDEFDEEGLLVRFQDYVDTQNAANAFA